MNRSGRGGRGSYYNNFFNTYRRSGRRDLVVVFNQERYSRGGIVIPPSGRISLSSKWGIFVNGKTVDEVAEIKKHYDEYIIDPQVTVSLEKAASYRYSILGDVGQPGIRLMSHQNDGYRRQLLKPGAFCRQVRKVES